MRLVVYPFIYKVLAPSQVVVWDFFQQYLKFSKLDCATRRLSDSSWIAARVYFFTLWRYLQISKRNWGPGAMLVVGIDGGQ